MALFMSGLTRQAWYLTKDYKLEPLPEARATRGSCAAAASALAKSIPGALSAEAKAYLAVGPIARQPPAPGQTREQQAAAMRAAAAARSGPTSERMLAALAADLQDTTMGGVPVLVSTPKLGVGPDGAPSGAGPAVVDGGAAILHFHGGAFILGTPRTMAQGFAPLSAVTGIKAVSVDYRLAPEHPFPAAVDDALAVYKHLLESHAPERVALAGESAGGGLAAALLLRLAAEGLPLPGAAVLLSPWAALNGSKADTFGTLRCVDPFLTSEMLDLFAGWYASDARLGLDEPMVSPAFADWRAAVRGDGGGGGGGEEGGEGEGGGGGAAARRLPAVLLLAGTRELLLSDAVLLRHAMRRGGIEAQLSVYDGMWHVWAAGVPGTMGLPEAVDAVQEAGAFILKHIPPPKPDA